MLGLGGASLGFLLWNWPPARIFMGDAGSGFLGFAIGTLGLAASQSGAIPAEVWPILGGVFLTNSTVTLVRRVIRGERWFDAHRSHAYQNLARRWRGHLPVTLLSVAVNVFWLLPWAYQAILRPERAAWYMIAALLPLAVLAFACGAGDKER
jgi:Fuc2NAc and GlcNAc transferase